MNATRNWDTAPAYTGEGERLPPGGYECRIIGARIETDHNGEKLALQLEIDAGEYKGFARRMYDRRANGGFSGTNKWPLIATQFTLTREGDTNPYFKGLITAIEASNPGYKWDWNEAGLRGKAIGYLFREEEFIGMQDGAVRTTVRPFQARSVESVRAYTGVPPKKELQQKPGAPASTTAGFTPVADDELPF